MRRVLFSCPLFQKLIDGRVGHLFLINFVEMLAQLARIAVTTQLHQFAVCSSGSCVCEKRRFAQTVRAIAARDGLGIERSPPVASAAYG